jgi:putative sigma-54 modulation protein
MAFIVRVRSPPRRASRHNCVPRPAGRAMTSRPRVERSDRVIVTIAGRHMDVTDALKTFAEQKVSKLTKYYDRIQEIEVIFNAEKDNVGVEVIVNAEHNDVFIAHQGGADAYASLDACCEKLERQLSDHKKLHRNRKHPDMTQVREGGSAAS